MSRIGDFVIEIDEAPDNDERYVEWKRKLADANNHLEPEIPPEKEWWEYIDEDKEWIKEHEKE